MTQAPVKTMAPAKSATTEAPAHPGEAIVQGAIKEISHIATLPEITLKIIKLVEDPDSSAQDLNKVITNDPALGARILKVVNSAFYGLPGQIGSINRAIVLLGLNAVKNIAIAASLAKLFRGGQISPHFSARDLWTHSVAVATGTRLLAEKVGLGLPDEAFLAGLIHDLGVMVEMQAKRNAFVEIVEKVHAESAVKFRDAEASVIGANHEQFGQGLCRAWKFPNNFANVCGYHHRPMELPEAQRTLPGLVHVADILARRAAIGYSRTVEVEAASAELMSSVRLTDQQLNEVFEQLPGAMSEAATLLNESAG